MPSEPKPGTPLPWGVRLDTLNAHDWLQLEQAARGCVSGSLDEWPDLINAIVKAGCANKIGLCMASVVTCCQMLVAHKELAELQKPCVWTYDEEHDKWDTACGEAFQTVCDSPTENGMKFCCFCQKPIQGSHPITESENDHE